VFAVSAARSWKALSLADTKTAVAVASGRAPAAARHHRRM